MYQLEYREDYDSCTTNFKVYICKYIKDKRNNLF